MKKVLFAIAMIAVVALAGCTKPEPKIQKRLVMCGDAWDKYAFTYGADGKIAISAGLERSALPVMQKQVR